VQRSRRPSYFRLRALASAADPAAAPARPLHTEGCLSAPPRLAVVVRLLAVEPPAAYAAPGSGVTQPDGRPGARSGCAPPARRACLDRHGRAGVRPSSGRTPAPRGRPRLVGGSRPRGGRQPSRGAAASRAPAVARPVQDGRARRMTATPIVERRRRVPCGHGPIGPPAAPPARGRPRSTAEGRMSDSASHYVRSGAAGTAPCGRRGSRRAEPEAVRPARRVRSIRGGPSTRRDGRTALHNGATIGHPPPTADRRGRPSKAPPAATEETAATVAATLLRVGVTEQGG
jgi:hypothetical protein